MNDATSPKVSPLTTALNIFTSPSEAFATIGSRPTLVLFPMLLVLISGALMMYWYMSIVDFDYLVDFMVAMEGTTGPQRDAFAQGIREMGSTFYEVLFVSLAFINPLIVYAVYAGYLAMVSYIIGDEIRFGKWFSMVMWSSLVMLVGFVASAVVLMMNPEGRLGLDDVNALSLAGLLGLEPGHPYFQLLLGLSLPLFWHLALCVIAYRQWLSASWGKACAVVLGLPVFIYGIQILVIVL